MNTKVNSDKLKENIDGMISWLGNAPVYGNNGEMYSWINPDHPGFVYDEITCYAITFFLNMFDIAGDDRFARLARNSLNYILNSSGNVNGIGKDRNIYAFDTSILLKSLIKYSEIHEKNDYRDVEKIIADNIIGILNKNSVVVCDEAAQRQMPVKWSTTYSMHILKTAGILYSYYKKNNDEHILGTVGNICSTLLGKDARFFSENESIYTHALCYAVEGLIALTLEGYSDYSDKIMNSAGWLAAAQNEDGSMNNYYYNTSEKVTRVADATAQTVRIWLYADREEYACNIALALKFLKGMKSQEGGIYYSSDSRDINTLATIFSAQAFLWYIDGVSIEHLL